MSPWLRNALRTAFERDPVDAANDADVLRAILFQRAAEVEAAAPAAAPEGGRPRAA